MDDYGFFIVPEFPLLAFATAVEPLRMANRLSQQTLYRWRLFSLGDRPVEASNGLRFMPDGVLADIDQVDTLFVLSGINAQRYCDNDTLRLLRRLNRRGVKLGALSIGSHILAKAGLLDGYRCTIHWENMATFMDQFPALKVSPELFEIDRNRLTCSGGTAALDMMLYLIRDRHGVGLANAVAEQCIHPQIRDAHERQRMGLSIPSSKLLQVISQMQANLEEPLSGNRLAANASLTLRQLERLFKQHLQVTPKRYYLTLRLERARGFLRQTALPITTIAAACGFSSAAYFSDCYRRHFGYPPRAERKNLSRALP